MSEQAINDWISRGFQSLYNMGAPAVLNDEQAVQEARDRRAQRAALFDRTWEELEADMERSEQELLRAVPDLGILRRTDNFVDEDYNPEPIPESFPIEIEPEKECPVCQEGDDLLSLGCRHTVCNSCIRLLPQRTCPQCREPIALRLVRKLK